MNENFFFHHSLKKSNASLFQIGATSPSFPVIINAMVGLKHVSLFSAALESFLETYPRKSVANIYIQITSTPT